MGTLKLSERPDGYGFLYGQYKDDQGVSHNVNVIPPERLWDGDFPLEGYEPHASEWIILVNGQEVARASEKTAVATMIENCLK